MGDGEDWNPIEPLFEAIVAHSTDSIMLLDLEARIQFINRTAPGLTMADVRGKPVYAFVSEDQHAEMRRCFENVRATGAADRYENVYHVSPDVVTRWESRVGPIKRGETIAGFVVFASDVTARTTAAAERDQVFELSADFLCVARFDGHFARVNPAFVRTLGYTEAELLAIPFIELVHPDDRAATKLAFTEQIEDGRDIKVFENRYVCKDGAIRLLQWTAKVDRITKRVIAVARDVTDQRALEAQLRQSQKMDAVGQLAGGIAHDFNNLVQAILGNVHFALATDPAPEMRSYLADIEAASVRASRLTKQLLTFGRRAALTIAPVDLNAVVRELMQLLRRVIPGHTRIEFVAGHHLGTVDADRGQLEQVIMNLCLNARDAMPSGGQIRVETRRILIDESFVALHPWSAPGAWILVEVADSGAGMTPEVRERIFEPFFTTKPLGEGSGLGLAVAYGIVQQHAGMLEVESQPGRGTTFKLYLRATKHAGQAVESAHPASRLFAKETILIAEDEELVRNVLIRAFEHAGYHVIAAANGSEALRLCREHDKIDLAVLDVVMPDLSGPEVYEHVQKLRPGLPALFCSGYSDTTRITHRIPETATVLGKPFDLETLLTTVRKCLEKKL
ncbi:MAG: PAS domain S-box protein [Myxococcales bacterium]|nr:PAS domain S-box protein [Myxococcales bacterium]